MLGRSSGWRKRAVRQGRTTEFFRDPRAPVFRSFVLFVAFCRFFRTIGGRIPTEANKGNEELGQGQEGERGSIGGGISEYMRLLDTVAPHPQQNPLCEDFLSCIPPDSLGQSSIA